MHGDKMKCVRELFKEEQPNKQLLPLVSELTTFTTVQLDYSNRGETFPELDSFLFSQETFDDFIPELTLPNCFDPLMDSTPIKPERDVDMSCHNWMEPLTVDIDSESSFGTSDKGSCNSISPSKCLLRIAPKTYHNRRLPNKMRQTSTETSNRVSYPYVPRKIARRKRTIFTSLQRAYLEERFAVSRYMDSREAVTLGQYIGIPQDTLLVWFQNRRARQRKMDGKKQRLSKDDIATELAGSPSDRT